MSITLLLLILLLLLLNYAQFRAKRTRSRSLQYISSKLDQLIADRSMERLLLVTDDKELQELLNAINRLLDHNHQNMAHYNDTEQSMRRMLSNISHDLKTPLTVVLGYIETLLHQHINSPKEQERLLRKVNDKAVEIVGLINSFFDLAKLESGDTELPLTIVHMNELCRNNMLMFYESASSQGLEAAIEIPDTPIYVYSHEESLNRILNNLLANAIRHGRDGRVLGLTLRTEDQAVYIDVWDRGRGIHERHQDLVFERMYTLDDSRNKAFQGSGLGLTITKRLVENIGGGITLHSKPYERTTFTVKLPRAVYEGDPAAT
ncbi:sensor histidine kinase [Paenibacillus oenotherae]|uniref:histidine kinase n=1 Tax=Paenibacillus oenotherae TaxID=1435645 RepID=A0ABS7D8X0_9BACL|nr:sensor histidine kinase [Paenibacillus oenotherae]MBW7476387.1 sensor histidine kinase [Paenibacillus oenotherae]